MYKTFGRSGLLRRKRAKLFAWSLMCVLCVSLYSPSKAEANATIVYLTSGSTWTVPYDWNSASNTIQIIGAGGGGGGGGSSGAGGGAGGGAYAKKSNLTLTPGEIIDYAIGAGGTAGPGNGAGGAGGDTWFNGATFGASSVGAKGGEGGGAKGLGGIGGAGGSSTASIGDVTYAGGTGGTLLGGGGGAAGPYGAGANGGGGGGGAGTGGAGGNGYGGAQVAADVVGNAGAEWGSYGSGSGGGSSVNAGNGHEGGLYGGGGGAAGDSGYSGAAGQPGIIRIAYTPVATTEIFLTSGTSWTVPDDWNSASNTIEVIGGGGSGMTSGSGGAGSSGGGGGAYSKITNAELIPGSTVTYSVGAGGSGNQVSGGDTWLCETTTSCTAITGGSVIVGAKAGTGGDPGLGGAAASGVGDTKYSGGNGGAAASNSSGGGGGAAGKNGNGANGGDGVTLQAGAGGGGGNGGTAGSSDSGSDGGAGGNNYLGTGGGAGGIGANDGAPGTDGGGGGGGGAFGGSADNVTDGGNGGAGIEWGTIGAGGGGGGGRSSNGFASIGGHGGLYGAGGGGGARNGALSGDGAQGLIVIRYTPLQVGDVEFSGVLYEDDEVTPAAAGEYIYAKIGNNPVISTTTRSGGAWTFPPLDATSTTPIVFYVADSDTLEATTFLQGVEESESVTNIPLYDNTVVVMSTSSAATIDLDTLKFYDASDDTDVLYHAPVNGTTTIYGNLLIATSTVIAPETLVVRGDYTNNGTFDANGGVLVVEPKRVSEGGFDLDTTDFDSLFSIATEELTAEDVVFSSNGRKMFVLGSTGDDVNEYVLGAPYDVSTATFVDSFSISAQELTSTGLAFNNDGTKMYVVGTTGDTVYQYTLSTAWDVSTASYASISFSIAGQEATAHDVTFNDDGTKMYIVGQTNDTVYEYTLSTAFTVSSATYARSFSVSAEEATPVGVTFSANGDRMFLLGSTGDDVSIYTLSIPWKVTSATFKYVFSIATEELTATGIDFSPDGTQMFVVGSTGDDVNEYHLEAPFDLAPYFVNVFDFSTEETAPYGIEFSTDGTKMYIIGLTGDDVNEYALSTPWNPTTAVFDSATSIAAKEIEPTDLTFSATGSVMYIVGESSDSVHAYKLSTPWDSSTATFWNTFSVATEQTLPGGVVFSSDGMRMFVSGQTTGEVNQYTLSTAWDVSSASFDVALIVSAYVSQVANIAFSSDGTKLFVIGFSTNAVNEFHLSDPWNLYTTVHKGSFSASLDTEVTGLTFSLDGTKMYTVGFTSDEVNYYELPTKYGVLDTSLSGEMTSDSAINSLRFEGESIKTFTQNATTTNFVNQDSDSTVVLPTYLEISGNLHNEGIFNIGGHSTTTFTGSGTQTLSGVLDGEGALKNVVFKEGGTTTIATSLTAKNVKITSGEKFYAPEETLTVSGNFENSGTFNHRNGTLLFTGTTTNTITDTNTNHLSLAQVALQGEEFVSTAAVWTTSSASYPLRSVTYGEGLFVAVATSSQILTSPDGVTWTLRTSPAATSYWSGITYANGRFVAVGCAVSSTSLCNTTAGGNRVMTSDNGIDWTARNATEANSWFGIAYGNGTFVAVSTNGTNRVMTSPDGVTWTPRSASEASTWTDVAYGNGTFVAIADSGTNRVMTSSDGATWTSRTAAYQARWSSVTYGEGIFVAVSRDGEVMTSPDGVTWTPRTGATKNQWRAVNYGSGLFVAVADDGANRVMTSPDGITWTSQEAADTGAVWRDVAYGDNRFVAVAVTGSSKVMVSTDGVSVGGGEVVFNDTASTTGITIGATATLTAPSALTVDGDFENNGTFTHNNGTVHFTAEGEVRGVATGTSAFNDIVLSQEGANTTWTARTGADANLWNDIAYGNGTFVAIARNGTNKVMTSPDGVTWTMSSAASTTWQSVTYGEGLFVAVASGRAMTSPDGVTWTSVDVPNSVWLSVTYGNGRFVAVAQSGTNQVMYSDDGLYWTKATAAEATTWWGVTYGEGLFVAIASAGTNRIMTSPDGITWTGRSVEASTWSDITYGEGRFVAVASAGTNRVLTSEDGIIWTPRSAAEANSWWDVAYGNGFFVAVSSNGTNRVMYSEDGFVWQSLAHADTTAWDAVTYGEGLFVSVGQTGGTNRIMTSPMRTGKLVFTATAASTTDLTISASTSDMVAPELLTIGGNYTNNGIFTAGLGTTTFSSALTQTATGTMTATSTFANVVFTGAGTKTFGNNASTTNLVIESGSTVVAPSKLTVGGNYTNSGTFTAGSGEVVVETEALSRGGYDIQTTNYNDTVTLAAGMSYVYGIAFNNDGTKMYAASYADGIYTYTLSTPYDASTAVYSSKFSVSETFPGDIEFNADGTKFFVARYNVSDIAEYHLSTPYDLATASFDSSKVVSAQDSQIYGFDFNSDGTKMFVAGYNNDRVYEYNLGTAYDVSTAVYDTFISVAPTVTTGTGLKFNPDGTKMFMADVYGTGLYIYHLAIPFEVTTAVYKGQFPYATWNSQAYSFTFNPDGTKLYLADTQSLAVDEFSLEAPFDLIPLPDTSFSVTSQDTDPTEVEFSSDGTKMYVLGNTNDRVYQYTLSTPFDVLTASYDNLYTTVTAVETVPSGFTFSATGSRMYIIGSNTDDVEQYYLATPWDISSAIYELTFAVDAQETAPEDVAFSSDGTKMFVLGSNGDDVTPYTLSTAWNVSSAVAGTPFSVAGQELTSTGLAFNAAGTKMYVLGTTGDDVNEYVLSTAWDISTAAYTVTFSVAAQDTAPSGVSFNPEGTRMYVSGNTGDDINQYNLTEFFTIATSTLSGNLTGSSAFNDLRFSGSATSTFGGAASTTDLVVDSGVVNAPSRLSIFGDYTNSGRFEAGTGTTTFGGVVAQTATGTMTGTSAFYNLELRNTAATTTLGNDVTVDNNLTAYANTTTAFPSSATTTVANIRLNGTSASDTVVLRSQNTGVQWKLNVTNNPNAYYVDVKDSNACPGIDMHATSSIDSGNNTCWNIVATGQITPTISSEADQQFYIGQATTSASTITYTDSLFPQGLASNDIRIVIATSTANMRFDTHDTSISVGGTASGKVSTTVSYEGDGSVMVINVTSNFSSNDTLTISGFSFARFGTLMTAQNVLSVRTDGASDTLANATDDKAITITGTLSVANHDLGQVDNEFSFQNKVAKELFAFKLTPAAEAMNIGSLTLNLTGVRRVDTDKVSNLALYRDLDSSGTYTAGDAAIGGNGALTTSEQTGTIVFSTPFQATTTQNYIVVADLTSIKPHDSMTISLSVAGSVTGSTSLASITPTGSVSSVQHVRGATVAGGGSIGGDAPAGDEVLGGGGGGGGGETDEGADTGEQLGNEPGFAPPTAHGTPYNEWINGNNAFASDGAYATAGTAGLRQSYSVFGFNIPGGNTVEGIEVKLEASGSTAAGTIEVALSWNGDGTITSTKQTGTLTTADAVYTLGGPSDLWGRSWNPSEFSNANFFVRVIGQPDNNTVRIDTMQVRPYHQAGGGGGGGGGEI